MELATLEKGLSALEQDERLWLEENIRLRQTAFEFIAVAEEFLRLPTNANSTLSRRLTEHKANLLEINRRLFTRLRNMIRSKAYSSEALRIEFNRFTDYAPHLSGQPQYGLDGLDLLLDGVFELSEPAHIALSNTEMVHYEPTPARITLELIDRAEFKVDDVFYDIGSGLGRVVLLVTLLSKIVAKGIECDPTLHTTATVNARAFGLPSATFIQGDARVADFSDGTIFFMFTPFKGEMFRSVMLKLRQHAEGKPMKIFSYGACTFWLAAQSWLRPVGAQPANDFTLGQFESNL